MRVAVVTVVAGRHDHLAAQLTGLADQTRCADLHVVVAMGDPAIADLVGDRAQVLDLSAGDRLPLAAARNAGATAALVAGAELLVFLDVDCIPAPALVERYAAAAGTVPADLLAGPVAYLPEPPPGGYRTADLQTDVTPHPARPAPPDGELQAADDHRLFWSLSFAATAGTWARVGGFCEAYAGYGGEDTDFAETAHAAGVGLSWVGGALAWHQWHPVSRPPVEHLDDVLANGRVFADRWGWWPMTGWLEAFAELGLIRRAGADWVRT